MQRAEFNFTFKRVFFYTFTILLNDFTVNDCDGNLRKYFIYCDSFILITCAI